MTTTTGERVKVEVADHVATVTLTRPDKHNALDLPMFEGIIGAAEAVAAQPGVRAVVLHGDGPSFCSGLDIMSLLSSDGGPEGLTARVTDEAPNWFQRAAYDWIALPMPCTATASAAASRSRWPQTSGSPRRTPGSR
jgi:enoyl-CoA hydratase/carnithine racemase